MAEATGKNLQKRLANLVDGKVVYAPHIQSIISAQAMVTGTFDQAAPEKLATSMQPK